MVAERPHFNVLDSWRGICACMVALVHFNVYSHVFDQPAFMNAGYYVDFFFVLSGFVIFSNYQERLKDGFGIKRFMLIRFGRIYPLHFLTLMLFILHELLQLALPASASISTVGPFQSPGEGPLDILINLTLLHSFDLVGRYSLNSPSWSIAAEFYTYALFALLIACCSKWQSLWMSLIVIGGYIHFEFFDGKYMSHDWGIFRCIYGFAVGGLCWMLWNKYQEKFVKCVQPVSLWSALEALTIGFVMYLIIYDRASGLVGLTPFVIGTLIFVFAFERGHISRVLAQKVFLFLGALSYSIYMIHGFISWKVIEPMVDIYYHFSDVQITTVYDGLRRIGVERWQGDVASVVYLGGVVFASYLSYRFFEIPCRDYFKRKANALFGSRSSD